MHSTCVYRYIMRVCSILLRGVVSTCADPEGAGTRENHKNMEFQYWSGSPEISQSYQASIQCWANMGMPAKHHLMASRWWADDGSLIVVFGSFLPSSTKKVVKIEPPL